jgi:3D (Asp-Asp-Asp) domain-containing protein
VPFATKFYVEPFKWKLLIAQATQSNFVPDRCGRVEDVGGAIKGQHIDLYRTNHGFAASGVSKQ